MEIESLRGHIVMQKKPTTGQLEMPQIKEAVSEGIRAKRPKSDDFLFLSPQGSGRAHLSTRQKSRIVHSWVAELGADQSIYATHSIRRTKSVVDLPQNQNS